MAYIYVIQMGTDGPIKIGRTRRKDVPKRLKQIQHSCPAPLALLGARFGHPSDEKWLHQRFARYRTHGEWFTAVPQVMTDIQSFLDGKLRPESDLPPHLQRGALSEAIARTGGSEELAKRLGISRQAVEQWKSCPPHRVLMVEQLSGVPRELLRPDLYPNDKRRAS